MTGWNENGNDLSPQGWAGENIVPLYGRGLDLPLAQERAQTGVVGALEIERRPPLIVIREILAMENTTAEQLFTRLSCAGISPKVFAETLFKGWFEPGIIIPQAAKELIRTHPDFRDPNAPWSIFVYAQDLLRASRGNPQAKQLAVLEWIHFMLGKEWSEESFHSALLAHDSSPRSTLSGYPQKLRRACDGTGNQSVMEVFSEARIESDAIIRLCVILSNTPYHHEIVADLRDVLDQTWNDMTDVLSATPTQYPGLIEHCKELRGRTLVNFGHCVIWRGNPEEIGRQLNMAHNIMQLGHKLQEEWKFGHNPWRPERARMDFAGNAAIATLSAISAIEESQGGSSEETIEKREEALKILRGLYRDNNDRTGLYLHSGDAVEHFLSVTKEANNHDIETVAHLVRFDRSIPRSALQQLANHLVMAEYKNPVFEGFKIQIFRSIVDQLDPTDSDHRNSVNIIHNLIDTQEYRAWSVHDYAALYASLASYWMNVSRTIEADGVEKYRERAMRANFQSMLLVDPSDLFPKWSPLTNIVGAERVSREGIDPATPGLEGIVRQWGSDVLSAGYKQHTLTIKKRLAQKHTHPDPELDVENALNLLATDARKEMFFWMCRIQAVAREPETTPVLPGNTTTSIGVSGIHLVLTYPKLLNEPMARLIQEYGDDLRDIMKKIMANHRSNEELRETNETLRKRAYENDLTGLPKEAKLREDIEAVWQENLNIAFIRIRGFKSIWNIDQSAAKTLSHKLALLLGQHLEDSDCSLYHPSYSTFAITQKRNIPGFRELIEAFGPFTAAELDFANGFEIGWVEGWGSKWDYDLMSLAGFALGESASEPNKVHWLKEGEENSSRKVLEYTQILKDALSEDPNHQFEVHYQKIYDPENPDRHYLEGLARIMRTSEDGDEEDTGKPILPGSFLPIARQNGLIPLMTRRVLEQTRQDLIKYPNTELSISVNIDGPAWESEEVMELLEEMSQDFRIRWRLPVLEILETVKLGKDEESLKQDIEKIRRLKSLGYTFAIDDFGAGESNTLNAAILGPEIYKLDHKFVLLVQNPDLHDSIIAQIRGLVESIKAHNPNAVIVAEHIENEELLKLFKELGVTRFQGFHIGRPSRLSDVIPPEPPKEKEEPDDGQWRLLL